MPRGGPLGYGGDMDLSRLLVTLDDLAPLRHAEGWDNVGLLVGLPDQQVSKALMCIDYTPAVAAERRAAGADLVIAYHPPIFTPLKRLNGGPVVEAVRDGVAIYSPHTALDVAAGGTNDGLADALGLSTRRPLRVLCEAASGVGMGRVGEFETPVERGALVERLKQSLGLNQVLIAGPATGPVSRAAVCAGSCGDLLDDAIAAGAEVYVTGEMRHHDALKAAAAGVTVVMLLHSNSERHALATLAARLRDRVPGVEFLLSREDRDPFRFS